MLLIGKAAESKQVKQEVNRRYSETSPYEVNTFLSSLIPSVRQGKKKIAMEAFCLAFNFFDQSQSSKVQCWSCTY